MTAPEAMRLLVGADLVELGMEAQAERQRRHPENIVSYCLEEGTPAVALTFDPAQPQLPEPSGLEDVIAVLPGCVSGVTASEYLKFVAVCRLYLPVPHILLDPSWSGLKVAQLALRFGANDFGNRKPGSPIAEEEIRRVIRDAGFVPKRRDAFFRSLTIN